ncbi:MAG: hypothetical protein MZV70_40405 [Desulfobacterales bacterium]|nr:hypothetical protein [Desulfobacterales bacterium]
MLMVPDAAIALLDAAAMIPDKAAAQPQVVRKKIAAPADRTQPVPKVAAAADRPCSRQRCATPEVAHVEPQAPGAYAGTELRRPKPDGAPAADAGPPRCRPPAAVRPRPPRPATVANAGLPMEGSEGRECHGRHRQPGVVACSTSRRRHPTTPRAKRTRSSRSLQDEGQQVGPSDEPQEADARKRRLSRSSSGQLKLVAIIAAVNRQPGPGRGILRQGVHPEGGHLSSA